MIFHMVLYGHMETTCLVLLPKNILRIAKANDKKNKKLSERKGAKFLKHALIKRPFLLSPLDLFY